MLGGLPGGGEQGRNGAARLLRGRLELFRPLGAAAVFGGRGHPVFAGEPGVVNLEEVVRQGENSPKRKFAL